MARQKPQTPPVVRYTRKVQPFNPRKPDKFGMRVAVPRIERIERTPASAPAVEQEDAADARSPRHPDATADVASMRRVGGHERIGTAYQADVEAYQPVSAESRTDWPEEPTLVCLPSSVMPFPPPPPPPTPFVAAAPPVGAAAAASTPAQCSSSCCSGSRHELAQPAAPPIARCCYGPLRPDADAVDCPPAGEGGRPRKRKASGAQRAAKKAAKKAEDENGGYTDKGRLAFKAEGGALVTGGERTCVPDALCVLLHSRGVAVDIEEVRSIMPAAVPDQNTRFAKADEYVERFGLTLGRVTKRFHEKGGPAFHLLRASGHYIVQLRVATGKDDAEPDLHCVAYDGATVRDNHRRAKVKELDASDRTEQSACKVFDSLFPGLEVRIKNVYELAPRE